MPFHSELCLFHSLVISSDRDLANKIYEKLLRFILQISHLKERWWTMSTVYLDEQKQNLGTILHL